MTDLPVAKADETPTAAAGDGEVPAWLHGKKDRRGSGAYALRAGFYPHIYSVATVLHTYCMCKC